MLSTCIIFDCDGVLFDSNDLKSEAFRQALDGYPASMVADFVSYHRATQGVSRYEKLRRFLTEFAGRDDDEREYSRLVNRFSQLCQVLYETAPLTDGCEKVLRELARIRPLFVASGSDECELRHVFSHRGLADYFVGIYGSPPTKVESVRRALAHVPGIAGGLLVGDAVLDHAAATAHGLDFVFMQRFSDARAQLCALAEEEGFPVIDSLTELPALIAAGKVGAGASRGTL